MIPLYVLYYVLFLLVIVAVIIVFYYDYRKNVECPDCGKKMKSESVRYIYEGHEFGYFAALVCKGCNQTYFTEESFKRIEETAKKLGLWRKKMQKQIKQKYCC